MNIYRAIADEVNVDNMIATDLEIAKYERLSGSAEERKAVEYLKKRLEEYGYTTHLYECQTYIGLPKHCSFTIDGKAVHAQTHALVISGCAEGSLIYCNSREEIQHRDCAGKIIMMPGRATFPEVKVGQDAGAVGMVFIQEAVIRESIPSGCWGSPTRSDYPLLPKIPVASIVDTEAAPYVEKLQTGTAMQAELTTETDMGWRKIPLLIGEIKAPVPTDYFVQFSGHQDSWYYGATDNGTVNALQVEMARLVKGHQSELKRNFRIVIFSGHSHGRYAGSAWYADHFWEDLHKHCVINVNADTVGTKGADDVIHSIVMPQSKDLGVQIVKELTGEDFVGRRPGRLGDQSFWNVGLANAFASFSRQKKIRKPDGSLGFERGNAELGWGWHTPDDLPKWIDRNNYIRDGKIFAEYIMTCLTEDVIPIRVDRDAEDIVARLKEWDAKAGNAFNLSDSIARAEHVVELCQQFNAATLPSSKRNKAMLRLCRILVPLDFTRGNIYGTEPAIPVDPMPSLSPIKDLVAPETSDMDKNAIIVELTRAVNFINDSLDRAKELLEDTMA